MPFPRRMGAYLAGAFCLALLTTAPGAGRAQAGNPFIGQWVATWAGEARMMQADLKITDGGGFWRVIAQNKFNPCIGLKVAVRHEYVGEQQMRLTLLYAEALQGCKDLRLALVQHPDGHVTGRLRGEYELALVRR